MSNPGILLAQPPQHTPEASLGDKDHTTAPFYSSPYSHDGPQQPQAIAVAMNKSSFSEWAATATFADEDPTLHHDHHHHDNHHDTEPYNMNDDPLAADTPDGMQAGTDILDVPMEFQHHHHEKRPAEGDARGSPNGKRLRLDTMLSPMDESNMTSPTAGDVSPVAATITTATKKVHNDQWDSMFERLIAYKHTYGNCLVPKRFADDPKLGTWVETQVRLFNFELEGIFVVLYKT